MNKCAVCLDNIVVNIIVALPSDEPPIVGSQLIALDDSIDCDIGWILTKDGFINPNPSEWSEF